MLGVVHSLKVQQDRLGGRVLIDVVDQVGKHDIDAFPQRQQVRKADPAPGRPVDHGVGQHARLPQIRHLAPGHRMTGVGRIEPSSRHDQAHALRPQYSNAGGPGRIEHALADRRLAAFVLFELTATGQYQGRAHPAFTQPAQQFRQGRDRRTQDRQVHHLGKLRGSSDALDPVDAGVPLGVDRPQLAAVAAVKQIANDLPTRGLWLLGGTHHGDRGGIEKATKKLGAHR